MVRIFTGFALLAALQCGRPFVMKPQTTNHPIMVGEIRQIGGERVPVDAARKFDFSTEIEILDTPTANSFDWYIHQQHKLDHRLAAATLLGARDCRISEVKFGSYVFMGVLFYLDKDWIRVSGYTGSKLTRDPERSYYLTPVTVNPSKAVRGDRPKPGRLKKEKRAGRKRR
ncbi:hypothetical protein [Turneriella parva]|uniref:Uncharacterized protein n=1 Tax=Turneriella parva (strain ATCC BAA-1111 / DSM 21527 / NCTC 11395 / H) TaxID=869212 RepID=I4B157_TURPD|nr:hypothetical protein [Turneriella parva]AFM11014.1 hypothetical protein Turpa_0358 [Turneriella parva DSM 21527]